MPKLDNFFNQTKNPGLEKNGAKKMHPQNINYKKLQESSYQYRKFEPGDVEKLADLIQTDGEVLQPLLVRKSGGDTYEILAGTIKGTQRVNTLLNSASWTSLHSFRAI